MKRYVVWLPLGFFIVIASFFFKSLSLDPNKQPSALIGMPIPDFQLRDLHSGRLLSVDDLPAQAYLINVWASWCITCQVEHPFLTELSKSIPIIGLNYKDQANNAITWLARWGDSYTLHIHDPDGGMGLNLGVAGAPETFVVDSEGIIRVRVQGELTQRIFDRDIAPILDLVR